MKKIKIKSKKSLKAVGGYAQALEISDYERMLFISGQIPVNVDDSVPKDFRSQCEIVWQHIDAQLEEANMTSENIVKVTTFLSDRKYADENSIIRQKYLRENNPALTVIITGIYDENWLVEIEAIAAA
jgi:2-iminobutanoate/2-iminopropanoate deaminase